MVTVLISVSLSAAITVAIAVGVKRQTIKLVTDACNANIAEVKKIRTLTLDDARTNGITTRYADNVICRQELRIFLEGRDLYELQNQEFYPDLMKFLDNTRTQGNTYHPARGRY